MNGYFRARRVRNIVFSLALAVLAVVLTFMGSLGLEVAMAFVFFLFVTMMIGAMVGPDGKDPSDEVPQSLLYLADLAAFGAVLVAIWLCTRQPNLEPLFFIVAVVASLAFWFAHHTVIAKFDTEIAAEIEERRQKALQDKKKLQEETQQQQEGLLAYNETNEAPFQDAGSVDDFLKFTDNDITPDNVHVVISGCLDDIVSARELYGIARENSTERMAAIQLSEKLERLEFLLSIASKNPAETLNPVIQAFIDAQTSINTDGDLVDTQITGTIIFCDEDHLGGVCSERGIAARIYDHFASQDDVWRSALTKGLRDAESGINRNEGLTYANLMLIDGREEFWEILVEESEGDGLEQQNLREALDNGDKYFAYGWRDTTLEV